MKKNSFESKGYREKRPKRNNIRGVLCIKCQRHQENKGRMIGCTERQHEYLKVFSSHILATSHNATCNTKV